MSIINGNTQVTTMGGSGSAHAKGVVPDPGPTAGTTRFLREDAQWEAPPVMGASGQNHAPGAAPDPGATAGTTRYLREDATWQEPPQPSWLAPKVLDVSTTSGTLDIAAGSVDVVRIALTQNVTTVSITGLVDGQRLLLIWKQNSSGPWTVTLPANFLTSGSIAQQASTQTLMEMVWDDPSVCLIARSASVALPIPAPSS